MRKKRRRSCLMWGFRVLRRWIVGWVDWGSSRGVLVFVSELESAESSFSHSEVELVLSLRIEYLSELESVELVESSSFHSEPESVSELESLDSLSSRSEAELVSSSMLDINTMILDTPLVEEVSVARVRVEVCFI